MCSEGGDPGSHYHNGGTANEIDGPWQEGEVEKEEAVAEEGSYKEHCKGSVRTAIC